MRQYTIRGGVEGRERLHLTARIFESTTRDLLRRAGISEGMQCLDVGCGGGHVTMEMARLVGPQGRAVGMDIDSTKLDLNRQDAEQQRLTNVEFRKGDAHDLHEESLYDIVYSRAVLCHLRDPGSVVEKMARAAKPGGAVVVEDVEMSGHFCYPENRAFNRYLEMTFELMRQRGADPDIGRKLPELLRNAGVQDVHVNIVHPVFTEGDGKLVAQITMENLADAAMESGLASRDEIDSIIEEIAKAARDPRTIMSMPCMYQVWGTRKPS